MNLKTLIAIVAILSSLGAATVASYKGLFLETEAQPLTVREESAGQSRTFRGGGIGYGK